jgi:hypothetical protein
VFRTIRIYGKYSPVDTASHSEWRTSSVTVHIIYDMIYIFNCNWVDTRWQQYSSHLHINSTHVDTRWQQYSSHLHTNSTQVDTRWQQYNSHLHTNSTQNTPNRTYITITKIEHA